MQHSPHCTALVRSFEGLCLKAVPDPKTHSDPWTIGYGHTGPDVHPGLVWTADRAAKQLEADLTATDARVTALLDKAPTTQPQFDALASFAFNLGAGALARSTLLRKHRAGMYADAAAEFGRWVSPGSNVENGLRRRRAAEAALYQSGKPA